MTEHQPVRNKVKVLFVCMGNICRSPSAEAVFRHMVETGGFGDYLEIASAGTHDYHVGKPADRRSHQAASARGYDMSEHRAQHLRKQHFDKYDYIVVMDDVNHQAVMAMCPAHCQEKVHYFMDFAPQLGIREIPDPYYGGEGGFEDVLDLVSAASAGLMAEIRERFIDPPTLHSEINA